MAKRFPWKSNLLKIPASVRASLQDIDSEFYQVAATKKIARSEIAKGQYAHLGFSLENGSIVTSGPILPPEDAGKWSRRNFVGWDRQRKDWPMVPKTFTWESPNFGDGARNGWSMQSRTRDVYQNQVFEPQGMLIEPTVLDDRGGEHVVAKFVLTPVRDVTEDEADLMLLWALNILQENTGVTGVFPTDATREDYLGTVTLDWTVFPPGTVDEVVRRLTDNPPNPANAPDFERHVRDRVVLFEKFEPQAYLRGQGGFGSYFGAQFADDLVVFENLKYGNAVYILYENWAEVSRRSRLDLLRDRDAHFDRVVHSEGWQDRLEALIHDKLFERGLRRRRSGYRYHRRKR